jgi:hypothetical protein
VPFETASTFDNIPRRCRKDEQSPEPASFLSFSKQNKVNNQLLQSKSLDLYMAYNHASANFAIKKR